MVVEYHIVKTVILPNTSMNRVERYGEKLVQLPARKSNTGGREICLLKNR
jgi:hypothetical protein